MATMDSSLFPLAVVKIMNSSGSVCNRRNFHAGVLQSEGNPQTQMHPKRNRLKLAKTYRTSDNIVGNNPSHVTGSYESTTFCKGTFFTDAVRTTDDKDNLTQKEHFSQRVQNSNKVTSKRTSNNMSVQLVCTPAKREHASSDSSLKPAIDHFGSNKEGLTRFLQTEIDDGDHLIDQPKMNIGQIQETSKHDPIQNLRSSNNSTSSCREPPNVRTVKEMRLSWRKEIPSENSCELLKDIQKLNLQFPVQRFFTLLLKKGTSSMEESSALEAEMSENYKHHSDYCVQRKRKLELEDQYRTYKRYRMNKGIRFAIKDFELFSDVLVNPHSKYTNRLSRTKCRQQQTTFCAIVTEPVQNDSVYQNQRLRVDDVLWTDKYQPQQSSEVIGNSASVRQLHSWLKEWKTRADTEERRRRQDERRMKKEAAESWDCGDFVGDAVSIDQVKELCNTVLITGPSGVGKTAAVYACAQELGFKVFEVNSSALRCGRLLLSQLTEATQSHQMDLESIKPSAVESESGVINQSQIKPAPVSSTGKEAHRKVTTSPSKETSVCRSDSHNIRNPQPVKLTRFFKLSSKKSLVKTSDGPERCKHATVEPDRLQKSGSGCKSERGKESASKNQSRAIPVSLILFEEVDVIFPEDVGFLTAIKTFMSTSKRPIILTTNDPLFGARLKGHFDEIHFRTPSLQTIRSYLQCLCAVENMKTDPEYMAFLLCQNKGDIRQSILQLQLWVCSGGGSTELQILQNTLKCRSWTELKNSRCLEILAEKTGAGLLYFIIGSLFSPKFSSQSFYLQEFSNPNTKGEKSEGLMLQTSSNVHERKSACRGKTHRPKTISYPYSVKASDPSKQTNKLASEPRARGQSKSLIFQHVLCIGSFFDNMSFVDACLQKPSLSRTELCKTEALGWMGATLKDSLLDLQREEQIRQYFENSSQLLAFVEVLSFHRCQTELSGIWTEAARLREKMSSERWEQVMASFSQPFGQKYLATCHCKFCEPRVAQKHRELASILNSSRKICCLRNKRAFFMDYLPTLRSICRSERIKGQHSIRRSYYLSSLHLPRSTLELMAVDFP
ncbi:ATPase family AAA domain-containing protein 5b [Danio rerio]|uniref:ATPase family AAA domain-containing protein 5b n=2 Tax=Danio rerio TaxID=7955 RepID=A0A8M1NDC2_DANRE|nr:ATPase family AAA domain-containing protein 5b [Danio rerio]|eukprot:NP_001076298.2 ATPase family AAA domain containing 5b [Danio rerio]